MPTLQHKTECVFKSKRLSYLFPSHEDPELWRASPGSEYLQLSNAPLFPFTGVTVKAEQLHAVVKDLHPHKTFI